MNWGAVGAVLGLTGVAFGAGAFVTRSEKDVSALKTRVEATESAIKAQEAKLANYRPQFPLLEVVEGDTIEIRGTFAPNDHSCRFECPAGYVLKTTSYENPSPSDCDQLRCVRLRVRAQG